MKKNIFILGVLLIFANVLYAVDKKKKNDTVCFLVDLHCHNCVSKVEKNISWEKGVKDLSVNLEEKTVTIEYDTKKSSVEALKASLEKLGFTCQVKVDENAGEKVSKSDKKNKN